MWLEAPALALQADDRALVRRLRRGEERAFAEFFDAYFDGLLRFASMRLDGDHDGAKEVAQAAICRALEKLHTYRGEAPLFGWLCSICRAEIGNRFRRLRRDPPHVALVEDTLEIRGALESRSLGAGEDPESQLLRREVIRFVHLAVDHLPTSYARALEWRYADGLAVAEIAARLEITYKAAESLLSRARAAFRDTFASLTGSLPSGAVDTGRKR